MQQLKDYAPLITRIFLAAMFIPAGLFKIGDVAGFTGYLTSGGLPGFLAWPSILFEVLLGVAMLVGFQARWMALLGAGFCGSSTTTTSPTRSRPRCSSRTSASLAPS